MKKVMSTLFLTLILSSNILSQTENCSDITRYGADKPGGFYLGKNTHFPGSPPPYVEFGVPDSSIVKLTLEDISGMQVGSKVECLLPGGNYKLAHEVFFRNVELSSGVYLIKLSAESISIPKTDFNGSVRILIVK